VGLNLFRIPSYPLPLAGEGRVRVFFFPYLKRAPLQPYSGGPPNAGSAEIAVEATLTIKS
jgi:hypothetical protein